MCDRCLPEVPRALLTRSLYAWAETNEDNPAKIHYVLTLLLGSHYVETCIALSHLPVLVLIELCDYRTVFATEQQVETWFAVIKYHYKWQLAKRIKTLWTKNE